MGAKTCMLVYAEGSAREILAARPTLDRDATARLAAKLFPKDRLEPLADGSLAYTSPPDNEITIGCFPGLSIVAAKEFGLDYPSRLEPRFLASVGSQTVYVHAMHSVVDWCAFAVWQAGTLERSLSLAPDDGVLEDIGPQMAFEIPYWSGQHPIWDPEEESDPSYPFPFHPLELGEAALRAFFGYQIEGFMDPALLDPETVPLARFKRKVRWFKLW